MIDATGPSIQPSKAFLDKWSKAQERASRESDAWKTSPERGDPLLRAQLAQELGVHVDSVTIVSGARASATLIATKTQTAFIETPTFFDIPHIFRVSGCHTDQGDWDDAFSAIESGSVYDTAWFTSPFRNPDGKSLTIDQVQRMRPSRCPRFVVNEAYRFFAQPTLLPSHVCTVGTLSKVVGGGGRIGWINDQNEEWAVEEPLGALMPPMLHQRTWARFLENDGLAVCKQTMLDPVLQAAYAFHARLSNNGLTSRHDPAPFCLLRGSSSAAASSLLRRFHDLGVEVNPGNAFLASDSSVRLCFNGLTDSQAETLADIVTDLHNENLIEQ